MYCGSCLRDAALAAALTRQGHDVLFVPLYTPLKIEADIQPSSEIFYGGINVYLQGRWALFRSTGRWIDRWFDAPWLLRLAARFSHMTSPTDLAELTITVLRAEHGPQVKELYRLVEWLRQQPRPDVAVLPNALLAGLAPVLREALGCPVLCLLAGEDMFVERFPEPYRQIARIVLRIAAATVDGWLAPNRFYRTFMAEYLAVPEERIHLARIGVETRDYACAVRPARDAARPIVGSLARICPEKGLHVLVEAVALVRRQPGLQATRLRAAGYLGPEHRGYLRDVQRQARRLGFGDAFQYVGEVDRAGKVAFLHDLDVFSVPCTYPEPKGQFLPEALAAGVPVVMPAVGCLPEWIEATGGGLLVEPGSAQALAEGLARLLRDPAQAARLGRAGAESVQRDFTTEAMACAFQDVAARVVAGASPVTHQSRRDNRQ